MYDHWTITKGMRKVTKKIFVHLFLRVAVVRIIKVCSRGSTGMQFYMIWEFIDDCMDFFGIYATIDHVECEFL
jgi:hypothetical protein